MSKSRHNDKVAASRTAEKSARQRHYIVDPIAADSRIFKYKGCFYKFALRTQANAQMRATRLHCHECRRVIGETDSQIIAHIQQFHIDSEVL